MCCVAKDKLLGFSGPPIPHFLQNRNLFSDSMDLPTLGHFIEMKQHKMWLIMSSSLLLNTVKVSPSFLNSSLDTTFLLFRHLEYGIPLLSGLLISDERSDLHLTEDTLNTKRSFLLVLSTHPLGLLAVLL